MTTSRRPTAPAPDAPWGPRWTTDAGMTVLLEESHAIPLVDVEVVLKTGALFDPQGKEGLGRLAARLLRMGTKRLKAEDVDEAIDSMGAALSVDVAHSMVRLHASVIRRSLPDLLELLGQLVCTPALRATDLGLVQRETIADLLSQRDNDRWLASRGLRSHLFGEHPYARPTFGNAETIQRVSRGDVADFLGTHVVAENIVLGVAGDVTEGELRAMVDRAFAKVPRGRAPEVTLPVPVIAKGRRVLVVDKPERTQTQIFLGTLGTRLADPVFYPLVVANTAFGGTFTSRLVREVRSERGWSYAANARLGADRQREAWSLYTHPSAENAVDCIALELSLIEKFVEEGISAPELSNARDYLVKSHAFDRDTAAKRLEPRLDAEVQSMPAEFYTHFVTSVGAVTLPRANEAVRARLSHEDLSIVLVATAAPLLDRLQRLPGVREVSVVPFDSL
ncbi:M16 family metallopeptidase [Sandaracinus amylolyticus]|uniref:M16 family metallopeptidase n=1 Tax=Sandaracinus amylolyticus TaxID=927083 RepID=UPI001F3A3319|nr:pitrilysin family protein [Sandaracinus amylolyticus]